MLTRLRCGLKQTGLVTARPHGCLSDILRRFNGLPAPCVGVRFIVTVCTL